jgi:single-strand DNA-binding protein
MFQNTQIIGHVGNVESLRNTQSGKEVISFSVAVNEKFGKTEKTTWFQVTAWNGLAKVVAEYVETGKKLMVQGRIAAEVYMDKNNQPRASLKLTANEIKFI